MEKWVFLAGGIYLIVTGLTSKTFLVESDVAATEQERRAAKPTLIKRVLVIAAGVGGCLYAAVRFLH